MAKHIDPVIGEVEDWRIVETRRLLKGFHHSNRIHDGDTQLRHDATLFVLGAIEVVTNMTADGTLKKS